MTSLLRGAPSAQLLFITPRPAHCFPLPSRCRFATIARRVDRWRNNSKINVATRFFKIPRGELRSMGTAPTIATTPPVTRATSCTREITQTGDSAASWEENVH